MFCLTCKYPLGSDEPWRCPECGRAFDPQRPETYHSDSTPITRCRTIGNLVLFVLVAAYVAINAASFQLEEVSAIRFPMNAHGFFSFAGPVVCPILIGLAQALPKKYRPFNWYAALPAVLTLLIAGWLSFDYVVSVFASC